MPGPWSGPTPGALRSDLAASRSRARASRRAATLDAALLPASGRADAVVASGELPWSSGVAFACFDARRLKNEPLSPLFFAASACCAAASARPSKVSSAAALVLASCFCCLIFAIVHSSGIVVMPLNRASSSSS